MVRRGLRSLDELEESERAESEALVEVQSLGGFGVADWSTLGEPFTVPDLGVPPAAGLSGTVG